MYSVIMSLNHSIYLVYQLFSRARRTLTIILKKTHQNNPILFDFVGFLVGQVDPSLNKPLILFVYLFSAFGASFHAK